LSCMFNLPALNHACRNLNTGIGNGLMPIPSEGVSDESGTVSASNTGEDPVKVEGSGGDDAVDVGMDQLGGSKEDLGRSLADEWEREQM
jgi:hypothetical protein